MVDKKMNLNIFCKNQIMFKNKLINFLFIFCISFFISSIPNVSSDIRIKVIVEQKKEGNVGIIRSINKRGCPTNLIVDGYIYKDNDRCTPYLYKGNHSLEIEWSDLIQDCSNMFKDIHALIEKIDLSEFDASNVKYMGYMFYGCEHVKEIILPDINHENLLQAENMFYGCTSLISIEFKGDFNTKKTKNMASMFSGCKNLVSINFPTNFIISNGELIQNFFDGCISLQSINFNTFSTSNVINMACLFKDTNISSFTLNNFDTSNVKEMQQMFKGCKYLTSLDLLSFNYNNVQQMEYMLADNDNLQYVNFGDSEIRETTSVDRIFENSNKKTIIYANIKSPEDFFKNTNVSFSIVECGDKSTEDIMKAYSENKIVCVKSCKDLKNYKFKYLNKCFITCPSNTILNETNFICEKNETDFPKIEPSTILENFPKSIIHSTTKINPTSKYSEKNDNIIVKTDINIQKTDLKTTEIEKNIIKTEIIGKNTEKIITEETKILETTETEGICELINFFSGKCKNNYQSNEDKINFSQNIINKIMDGTLNELLYSIVNEDNILLVQEENDKYQISTISGQKKLENLTYIDFGECEDLLKTNYSLNKSEELIIYKIEHTIKGINIPIIEYALFSNDGSILLDINLCDNLFINHTTPVSLDSDEIYKYDLSSDYYSDICKQYSSNGKDMTIYDRKYEYNEKNMSLCEYNCTYQRYILNTSKVECMCPAGKNLIYSNDTNYKNNKQLLNKVDNQKKNLNFDVTQCINLLTSKEDIKTNTGFYILLFIIAIFIIVGIIFCFKGYHDLSRKIDNIIDKKFPIKKKIKKYNNKNIINNPTKKNVLCRPIKIKGINDNDNNNSIKPPVNNKNYRKNKPFKRKNNNSTSNLETMNENDSGLNNIYDNGFELNILPFMEALKYDKRKSKEYYCSLIIFKQILIYSFLNYTDYTPNIIKKFIFFLAFALHYTINAIFFNDNIMHKIYTDNGNYNIIYQISFICYSSIISIIILRVIMHTLILVEKNILEIKIQKTKLLAMKQKKISLKCIMIKYSIFFVLCTALLIMFWIYLTCFSAVYKNTQTHLIKNTLISFAITSVYPFFISIIPVIFRKDALTSNEQKTVYKFNGIRKSSSNAILKNREYIYKVSQFFQLL